jgi:hypothetical protein
MDCPHQTGGHSARASGKKVAEGRGARDASDMCQDRGKTKPGLSDVRGEELDEDIVERGVDGVDADCLEQVLPVEAGKPPRVGLIQPQALRAEPVGGEKDADEEDEQQGERESEARGSRPTVVHCAGRRFYRSGKWKRRPGLIGRA